MSLFLSFFILFFFSKSCSVENRTRPLSLARSHFFFHFLDKKDKGEKTRLFLPTATRHSHLFFVRSIPRQQI